MSECLSGTADATNPCILSIFSLCGQVTIGQKNCQRGCAASIAVLRSTWTTSLAVWSDRRTDPVLSERLDFRPPEVLSSLSCPVCIDVQDRNV